MTDTSVTPVQSTDIAGSAASAVHDMSVWGLFLQADWVVKLVMFGLLLASFYSWAIIIEKYTRFKTIRYKSTKFENDFWSTADLERFYEKVRKKATHPMAMVFVAGMEEWYSSKVRDLASVNAQVRHNLQARITQLMGVARNRELDKLESGLGFLATVGSAAPFIGLFGTVWGIMNSFTHIAASKNTSLAVVAPGIAEALFATAIGLFAAIPAVIAYNKFSGELDKFAGRLEDFSTEFNTLLSRQIDGGSN